MHPKYYLEVVLLTWVPEYHLPAHCEGGDSRAPQHALERVLDFKA
jgi:hypothetical protein